MWVNNNVPWLNSQGQLIMLKRDIPTNIITIWQPRCFYCWLLFIYKAQLSSFKVIAKKLLYSLTWSGPSKCLYTYGQMKTTIRQQVIKPVKPAQKWVIYFMSYTHTHTHKRTHTCTHACTHTHTHTHIHTHTHTQLCFCFTFSVHCSSTCPAVMHKGMMIVFSFYQAPWCYAKKMEWRGKNPVSWTPWNLFLKPRIVRSVRL